MAVASHRRPCLDVFGPADGRWSRPGRHVALEAVTLLGGAGPSPHVDPPWPGPYRQLVPQPDEWERRAAALLAEPLAPAPS